MLKHIEAAGPSDLSLLTAVTNALRLLFHPDKPYSYCTRLYRNFEWCTEIATLLYNHHKSSCSPSIISGSNALEDNVSYTHNPFNFTQKAASAPFPASRPTTSIHDFEGDLRMDDGFKPAKTALSSSAPSNAVSAGLNTGDSSALQDPFSMSMFTADDSLPKGNDSHGLLAQPLEIPSESSAEFQDALKWVYDEGNGLDASFQQIMTDPGMLSMPTGSESLYNTQEA